MEGESPAVGRASTLSLPADIPLRREAGADSPIGSGMFALGFVFLLVIVGLVAIAATRSKKAARQVGEGSWRRLLGAPANAAPELQRIGALRLSPRHSLHIIQWEGRKLMIGCTADTMQVMAQAGDDTRPPDAPQGRCS